MEVGNTIHVLRNNEVTDEEQCAEYNDEQKESMRGAQVLSNIDNNMRDVCTRNRIFKVVRSVAQS